MRWARGFLSISLLISACSGPQSMAGTSGGSSGSSAPIGAHQPWPQVPNQGGPVLDHLELVTMTFAGDPNQATLESLGDWVVTSTWLQAVGSEYGVGLGTHLQKVRLPSPAPGQMSTSDVETLLRGLLDSGAAPAPGPERLYLLYVPSTTTVGDSTIGNSCQDFAGYHSEMVYGTNPGVEVAYGVVASCGADSTALAQEEQTATHELIETATDPLDTDHPAWVITDTTSPFAALGGEVADLCLGADLTDGPWSVQRIWSNHAAATGGSPCIPQVPGAPYFGFTATPSAIQVARPGQAVDFTVQAWATTAVDSATLVLESYTGFDPHPTLGTDLLAPGDSTRLIFHVPASAQSGDLSLLVLHAETAADTNDWPVAVLVQ
jgi:hypothetical protein